jgi:hypothetical protein
MVTAGPFWHTTIDLLTIWIVDWYILVLTIVTTFPVCIVIILVASD